MLDKYFQGCLYFSANRLSRVITKMAEEEFLVSGLSPTYAFLLMAVYDEEGISQKKLGEVLHIQPSTVTRFVEKLIGKGLLYSRTEGRLSLIYSTDKGKALKGDIEKCWNNLHIRYSAILGMEEGDALTHRLFEVSDQLDK